MLPPPCKLTLDRLVALRIPEGALPLTPQATNHRSKQLIDAASRFAARLTERKLDQQLVERANQYRDMTGPKSDLERERSAINSHLANDKFIDREWEFEHAANPRSDLLQVYGRLRLAKSRLLRILNHPQYHALNLEEAINRIDEWPAPIKLQETRETLDTLRGHLERLRRFNVNEHLLGCYLLNECRLIGMPGGSRRNELAEILQHDLLKMAGNIIDAGEFLEALIEEPLSAEAKSGRLGGPIPADTKLSDTPLTISKPDEFRFISNGDGYEISAFGCQGHFSRSIGFQILARVVKDRGDFVELSDFDGLKRKDHNLTAISSEQADAESLGNQTTSQQPKMDVDAKAEYFATLRELDNAIEKANKSEDHGEVERQKEEKGKFLARISKDLTIGKKSRDFGYVVKKRQMRINNALRRAYEHLRGAKPSMEKLANHFESNVNINGPTVIYRPTPMQEWTTSE